ncbi:MAG: methyltransferase domain-containing protein [Bacteroidota bacterium]
MKIPFWKRWLSYLTEIHIESAPSPHNPHLYVSLRRGRFQLSTANAIYSYEDLYDNFSGAFEQLHLDRLPGKEILILGFGLGSIPIILEKMGYHHHYTAVEVDESVVDLATRYAMPRIDSPVQMICADALAFVQQCQSHFDLIAVDLFLDDLIPAPFESQTFLERTKELLNPGGVLLYNRLAFTPQDKEEARKFLEGPFRTVFPEGIHLDINGNWMLLNHGAYHKDAG